MTFREKLADWVSGGALTKEKRLNSGLGAALQTSHNQNADLIRRVDVYLPALYKIRGLETPKASHSLKRAVRIANEALGK